MFSILGTLRAFVFLKKTKALRDFRQVSSTDLGGTMTVYGHLAGRSKCLEPGGTEAGIVSAT
jgi:hypothetical protein